MHSETERQFYLGIAGIQCWYARQPLPGAAPSPEFRFPATPGHSSAPEEKFPSPPTERESGQRSRREVGGADGIARLQSLMSAEAGAEDQSQQREAIKKPGVPPENGPMPDKPVEPIGSVPADVRLQLGFWRSGDMVLVSTISGQASARLQDELARNILKSVNQEVLESQSLHWPIFGNRLVPGNQPDDLVNLVKDLASRYAGKRLVLLGVDVGVSEPYHWMADAMGQPDVSFPCSLAELAATPANKRDLWVLLKPLNGSD